MDCNSGAMPGAGGWADLECAGGVPAPVAGIYVQRNMFGTPTGTYFTAAEGEILPELPRGFSWKRQQTAA